MKKLSTAVCIYLLLLLALYACRGEHTGDPLNSDFERYLISLDTVPSPFAYNTHDGRLVRRSEGFDKDLFERFKRRSSNFPLGFLSSGKDWIATVEVVVGDALVPIIMVYDLEGNKIDSLSTISKSGGDIGYYSTEYVTIEEGRITVIDSTRQAQLNDSGDDVLEDSWTLTVGKAVYEIVGGGRIRRDDKNSSLMTTASRTDQDIASNATDEFAAEPFHEGLEDFLKASGASTDVEVVENLHTSDADTIVVYSLGESVLKFYHASSVSILFYAHIADDIIELRNGIVAGMKKQDVISRLPAVQPAEVGERYTLTTTDVLSKITFEFQQEQLMSITYESSVD